MKVGFVSIKNAVLDFITDVGLSHDEIDDKLLIKWAGDCVRWFNTDQQLRHRIAILQVRGSRAELPKDFQILTQAASNVFVHCDCREEPKSPCCKERGEGQRNPGLIRTKRETLVQWVYQSMYDDCKVEVNLICPKCKKKDCGCKSLIVEVDKQFELSHPELYFNHFAKKGSFGYGRGPSSFYSPKFQLMNYATSNFFNIEGVLGECPNINCTECERTFRIDLPYIEVDYEKGEVLISYLGKVLDDDGELMLPDHPDAFEAVLYHLMYKWYSLQSAKGKESLSTAMQYKALRDESITFAKSALQVPDAHEWKSWLQNSSWLKRVPKWQKDRGGKNVRDEYSDYLNG